MYTVKNNLANMFFNKELCTGMSAESILLSEQQYRIGGIRVVTPVIHIRARLSLLVPSEHVQYC
jgi:hypothetical protein